MNFVRSLDQVEIGDVLWARARGYWRRVRVVGKTRRTATVAYTIHATSRASASTKVQDLAPGRLRHDRPVGHYGIVDAPAPAGCCGKVYSSFGNRCDRRRDHDGPCS
jgi:hypothetical protein